MARIVRSPRAKRDLVEALEFTTQRWGADQARRYADLIEEALETIAAHPERGKPRDEIRAGIRSLHIGQPGRPARHVLFYRISSTGDVEIIRSLHDAMDFGQHLR